MNPEPTPAPAPTPVPVFDQQAAIAGLQNAGYHVYARDARFDRQQAEADPFLKTVVAPVIAERISEIYVGLDKDIFESTGIPKNQGEKTYEYQKRVAAQLKDQIQKAPDVEKVKQEFQTQLSDKDKAIAEISLRSAISGLNLNVPAESLDSQRELLVMRALSLPHRIEGSNIIYQKYADDGKTLIDVIDTTTGHPMAAGKFLESQFKPFLAQPEPVPTGPNAKPKPADTSAPVPKSQQDLVQMLREEGVEMGGPNFMAKLQAKATEYAIKLDEQPKQ